MAAVQLKLYLHPQGAIRRFTVDANTTYEQFAAQVKSFYPERVEALGLQYVDEEEDLVSFSSQNEWSAALANHNESGAKLLRIKVQPTAVKRPQPQPRPQHCHRPCFFGQRPQHCQRPQVQEQDIETYINQAAPLLKQLFGIDVQVEKEEEKPQTEQPVVRHFGIVCDGCDQHNIVGDRYKCNDCKDFDYCGTCFSSEEMKQSHGNHTFTKVTKPVHRHPFEQFFAQPAPQQPVEKEEAPQPTMNDIFKQFFAQAQQAEQPAPQPVEKKEDPQKQEVVEEIIIPEDEPVEQVYPTAPVVEAPVETKPVEPVVETFKYAQELETLGNMGFSNVKLNKHLLENFKGDLVRVVNNLVQLSLKQ
jgi:hypothetical protein